MSRFEVRTSLDHSSLREILDLVDIAAAAGDPESLGEQKRAQLVVGTRDWTGILAYDHSTLLGYAHVRWNAPGTEPRITVEVVVHPQSRNAGVAEQLLDQTRALLAGAGGGVVFLWVHRVTDPLATFAARAQFEVQRELAYMQRPLDEPPPPPVLPEGVVLRAYRVGVDDSAFLEVNNAAFAGHPENGGWDAEEFAARRSLEWFDPDDLLLSWRGDTLLGFHWTKRPVHGANPSTGEVYVLAVSPQAQGGGLGRALLRAGLHHLYERGCRRVELYVDQASRGPVALYRAEGFRRCHSEVCYWTRVPPSLAEGSR